VLLPRAASSLLLHFLNFYIKILMAESLGNYWTEEDNQKTFFEDAAKELGLDPLIPEHWYSLEKSDFLPFKVFSSSLHFSSTE
jgi:hypothetical protein